RSRQRHQRCHSRLPSQVHFLIPNNSGGQFTRQEIGRNSKENAKSATNAVFRHGSRGVTIASVALSAFSFASVITEPFPDILRITPHSHFGRSLCPCSKFSNRRCRRFGKPSCAASSPCLESSGASLQSFCSSASASASASTSSIACNRSAPTSPSASPAKPACPREATPPTATLPS